MVCQILRHHRRAGHFKLWKSPELPPWTTTLDDHWQVNLCHRIGKILTGHLCRLWRIHFGINVSRQTVHLSLVQRSYWARGIPLPTHLAFSHQVLDFAGLLRHWLNVVFRTRGRCTLDRKDGTQIGGGNLRHYCIQKPALCDGGSVVVWAGLHKGRKRHRWLRMETSTPSCSWTPWKTNAFTPRNIIRAYGNNIRLQDVCPYMDVAVKAFLEAFGLMLAP